MCFFKRFYGCAAEAGTDTGLDMSMNPLFKESRPTGLSERPQVSPCSVPLQSWVVKSTFICKFLLTMDIVKGVTQCYSMLAKRHRYESLILGCTLAFWSSPRWCLSDAQHPFLNSERIETFWSCWVSGSGTGTHLSGRSMEAAAMQWTGAVHIDLVHIFQSLPVYCNHLVSCGNTSSQASECHYNLF